MEGVLHCIAAGSLARHTGSTLMNEHSSRSHSLLTLTITTKPRQELQVEPLALDGISCCLVSCESLWEADGLTAFTSPLKLAFIYHERWPEHLSNLTPIFN